MPKSKPAHMSWSIIILILLHTASLIYFLYTYFRTPPPPSTLVINLDTRKDKWELIQKEFANWSPPIERISAIKYSPGWKGCTLSHRKAMEIAKKRHYPWVLIVEDDCQLTPDAQERFHALLPYLWKHQHRWDVFLGGVTQLTESKVVSKTQPLFKVKGFTTHFCLIHRAAYNKILRHIPSDPNKMKDPVDVWYRDHLRLWTTVPFLAVQQPSYSDINKKEMNYTESFDNAEKLLRKLIK